MSESRNEAIAIIKTSYLVKIYFAKVSCAESKPDDTIVDIH